MLLHGDAQSEVREGGLHGDLVVDLEQRLRHAISPDLVIFHVLHPLFHQAPCSLEQISIMELLSPINLCLLL